MRKLVVPILILSFTVLLLAFTGCNSKVGIDSLSVEESVQTPKSIELSCAACHGSGRAVDPLGTGKHTKHVAERGYSCTTCHLDYVENANHMNGALDVGSSAFEQVVFNSANALGEWVPETGSCSSITCHGSDTVNWYDENAEWTIPNDCAFCHSSGIAVDPLDTGTHIRHVTEMDYSCSKCHFDYKNTNSHIDGNLDTGSLLVNVVVFDQINPDGIWTVDNGVGTGSCSATACHGADSVAWYDTGSGWTTPADCSVCHGSVTATRRQVMGPGGDFDDESHHVIDYSNRNLEIVTSNDCLVCHDQSGHMGGTLLLTEKDTSAPIVYDPASPASLEPFCLSCHDLDGATTEGLNALLPFSSGNTLGIIPNEAGDKIKDYWNNSDTVHRDSGLTCFGNGDPATGCHGNGGQINAHGSTNYGLLTKNLTLPVPGGTPYSSTDYDLCFSCHDSYPSVTKEAVLGYKQGGNYDLPSLAPTPFYIAGIQSLFREVYDSADTTKAYNDTINSDPFLPLHNYHLLNADTSLLIDWNYRGDTALNGKASCLTCHNVHGTGGTVRSTYDELLVTADTTPPDEYKNMAITGSPLTAYPINCASSCHTGSVRNNYYWHTPSGE